MSESMPKSTADAALLVQVNFFIERCGTRSAAAKKLGVHRSTLYRFMQKEGRALTRTQAQFRVGLADQGGSATPVVAAQPAETPLSNDQFAEMRRFCNSLQALLDERDRRMNTGDLRQA